MSGISKSSVSKLCKDIDERVNAFLKRPLAGEWPYLWLDATYLKVREGGRIVSVAAIIAVAVTTEGKREIVGLHIGPSEAEPFWSTFLRDLVRRGLKGVKLVISDAHEGLKAAITRVVGATWQRCRVHFSLSSCVLADAAPAGVRLAVRAGTAADRRIRSSPRRLIRSATMLATPIRTHQEADHRVATLRDRGFLIIENAVTPAVLARAHADLADSFQRAPFCDGLFYGHTTKRFGRLLTRLSNPEAFVLHPDIIALVKQALGDEAVQLNLSQAIEIHPGAPVQTPHRDHDMWRCAKLRSTTYMVNVMWALDDFTAENGATRVWPRSNHGDWDLTLPREEDAVSAVAPAGSAIIFLGQTLHSGGANRSERPRRGMIFSYCLDWLLPDENPWLAYPPEVAKRFSPALADLAGYRQRFAGLNNFEGRSPVELLHGEAPEFMQFADDMSPEQIELILAYQASIEGSAAAA